MSLPAAVSVARARLRRSWRGLVALGTAAGLAAGVVSGLVAGARRTSSAFDRLVEATGADFDVAVFIFEPDLLDAVLALAGITRSRVEWAATGQVSHPDRDQPENRYVTVSSSPGGIVTEHILVRGRLPNPSAAGEVVVVEALAQENDEDVGSTLHWRALTRDEFLAFSAGAPTATGQAELDLTVVGVVRNPSGVAHLRGPGVWGTPAFHRLIGPGETSSVRVQLASEQGRLDVLRRELDRLVATSPSPGTGFPALEVIDLRQPHGVIKDGLRTQGRGLFLAVVVVGLATALALAQAVDRRVALDQGDDGTLAALGIVRSDRVLAHALPFVVAAAPAMALSAGVAVASSVLTPIGSARRSEPAPGVLVDRPAVTFGAAAVMVFLLLAAAGSGWFRTRRRRTTTVPSRSTVAEHLASAGAPAPVTVGVRLALEPGRGSTRVPTRSTVTGVAAAVAGVVAVATVAASLDRLLATPSHYGWPAQLGLRNPTPELFDTVLSDSRVGDVTRLETSGARVGDRDVTALAYEPVRGRLRPTLLAGRLPESGEVAIGPELADELAVDVGEVVPVTAGRGAAKMPFRVVGITITSDSDSPVEAAVFTAGDLRTVRQREPLVDMLIGTRNDLDDEARARLTADLGAVAEIVPPQPPTSVRSLAELRAIPPRLTGALVLLGAAVVAHGVSSSARRRRRDLAVLRALGFSRRRIAAIVLCAAATTAMAGLLVGVPVGIAAGVAAWSRIADSVHVVVHVRILPGFLVVAGSTTVVLALVAAALPARSATLLRPADVLRTE